MTNDTTPADNGVGDAAAIMAALPAEATESSEAVSSAPAEPKPPSFDDMGLHPDVKQALDDMGYFAPTPVQTAVFTPVSEGKNLLVQSRTGTGKTTAFGLPLVNKMVPAVRQPQALILAPTRELALQVARELTNIGKHRGIVIEAVYGGAPIGKQITNLRDGVHIVVGTPGRVLDHIGRRTLDCKNISTFVLDECDEMLSMGFLEDIERVTSSLPEKHQTLLFSATMPDEVTRYARRHMQEREQISLSKDSISVSDIHHAYYIVSGIARSRDLLKIIIAEEPESAIIFCNMRDETTMVAKFLTKQGFDAEPLSSDLSQADRERVMGRMKAKNLRFLCATDVAARGIDISNLSHVINYSVPESPEVYVHRTGRTGRAGKKGTALSLVGPRELGNFRYVRLTFGIKPEERLLPKDSIFEGKLKVALPPIGKQQAPDPFQMLSRAVTGTPSDLEKSLFEKLLAKSDGRRVLAQLVAEKLNEITTKTSRPRRAERPVDAAPAAEGGERSDRPRFDDAGGGDRPRFRDRDDRGGPRGDRGDRPRFGGDDRGPRGDRPRFGGDDRGPRGDRPRFGADGGAEGGAPREDRGPRGDRPRFGADGGGAEGGAPREDRGPRGDRPRFGADGAPAEGGDRGPREDRGPRGDRPRFGADGAPAEGGDRGPREDRGPRGDRPRFDGPRDDRGSRGDRPRFDGPRTDGPRTDGPRAEGTPAEGVAATEGGEQRTERSGSRDYGDRFRGDRDRGPREDRGDRPRFDRDRDRGNRGDRPAPAAVSAEGSGEIATPEAVTAAPISADAPAPAERSRDDRGERSFDRDRGDRGGRGGRDRDRGGRDRDRGPREDRGPRRDADVSAAPAAPAESVEGPVAPAWSPATDAAVAAAPTAVEEVARGAVDRAKKKDKKSSEVTDATREFWETWAETKTSKTEAPKAEAADAGSGDVDAEAPKRGRGGRDRDRGGRGGRDRKDTSTEKKASASKDEDRPASRTKRDTVETPARTAAAADGSQARLFVSLGKKHGVSAEDLRSLLAGPIGGDPARIGSVSLRDSHAHVRVPEEHVDAIIAAVHGTLHKEHNVTVERARA